MTRGCRRTRSRQPISVGAQAAPELLGVQALKRARGSHDGGHVTGIQPSAPRFLKFRII